mmetsp:Transcript_40200/g.90755  ORF Transcript_40200/g.90755 Transcript_40200/m.90755 type:complete len:224 (-) Transcript_40200:327-998(-)
MSPPLKPGRLFEAESPGVRPAAVDMVLKSSTPRSGWMREVGSALLLDSPGGVLGTTFEDDSPLRWCSEEAGGWPELGDWIRESSKEKRQKEDVAAIDDLVARLLPQEGLLAKIRGTAKPAAESRPVALAHVATPQLTRPRTVFLWERVKVEESALVSRRPKFQAEMGATLSVDTKVGVRIPVSRCGNDADTLNAVGRRVMQNAVPKLGNFGCGLTSSHSCGEP